MNSGARAGRVICTILKNRAKELDIRGSRRYVVYMNQVKNAKWILTKLGSTSIPVICSSDHPDRKAESYDIAIGQSCFDINYQNGKLIDIAQYIQGLTYGYSIFAFKENLHELGISVPS